MTNAERIRLMNDEKLLDGMICACMRECDHDPARCKNYVDCLSCLRAWLAEEADDIENKEEKNEAAG